MNDLTNVTDWTEYYSGAKSWFSTVTQKITLKKLMDYFEKYADSEIDVMELGGGNSCFAQALMKKCGKKSIMTYSIIDSCELAVEKFREMNLPGEAYCADLTSEKTTEAIVKKYNVVYSCGLIEHFRGKDIEKIIHAHFHLCTPGGVVLISIPTPTLQYSLIRKGLEILGKWQFPDEKAIKYEEIGEYMEAQGDVLRKETNYRLPLTQLMIVARKSY